MRDKHRIFHFSRIGFALTLVAGVAIASEACDDNVTLPAVMPGSVILTLESPNGSEGAVVLEATDDGIIDVGLVDVTIVGGVPVADTAEGEAFHLRSGGISRIVAYRDQAGVISIEVFVEDVNQAPAWQIVEVADGSNELRASLSGYEVTSIVYSTGPPLGGGS